MNRELKRLTYVVFAMLVTLLIAMTFIQVFQADTLSADGRNNRTIFDSYKKKRGAIIVDGTPIAVSIPTKDDYVYQRTYTQPFLFAQTTGYFSLNQGITGIEGALNAELSGSSNSQFLDQLNAILTGKPITGASVALTLSAKVQKAAWDALKGNTGAVVVLEADTGRIVAMVSKPSYNPNLLASHNEDTVINEYK